MSRSRDYLFGMRVRLSGGVALIRAYDANHTSDTGHMRIDCELQWRPAGCAEYRMIFPRGATWCAVNRWTSIDGIEARELVMSLFAMKPGDTDGEYFDSYTLEQLGWAEAYGEELSLEREIRYCDANGNVRRRA